MMIYPTENLDAVHPGSILKDELAFLGISARKFAAHIHVPHNAVSAILNEDRSISAQMAIRLGLAFGTTAEYWLGLQDMYELKQARADLPAEARDIRPYRVA